MAVTYFKDYAKLQPVQVKHKEHRKHKRHALGLDRSQHHDVWKIKVVDKANALKIFQMFEHYQQYLKEVASDARSSRKSAVA